MLTGIDDDATRLPWLVLAKSSCRPYKACSLGVSPICSNIWSQMLYIWLICILYSCFSLVCKRALSVLKDISTSAQSPHINHKGEFEYSTKTLHHRPGCQYVYISSRRVIFMFLDSLANMEMLSGYQPTPPANFDFQLSGVFSVCNSLTRLPRLLPLVKKARHSIHFPKIWRIYTILSLFFFIS